MKWEFLRYEIFKFTISFSKNKTKSMREKKLNLEEKLKLSEGTVKRLKMSALFARKILMLFLIKSEVDATGMNLVKNLINSF